MRSFKVFGGSGCPEVIGLDDKGRMHVLSSYSGRWTPTTLGNDGKWLGGVELADIDPRFPGQELYVGGERGYLYQSVPHPNGVLDWRFIGETPGQAINIIVAADIDPSRPGTELLLFTWPSGLWLATPSAKGVGFDLEQLDPQAPRVRDAFLLPASDTRELEIIAVARGGLLRSLRFKDGKPVWKTLHQESMGMGRVAMKPKRKPSEPLVLYTTLDDGRVLRHERGAEDNWKVETIYLGPQGPRGLATGRFDADPEVETIAIFGYSKEVELLRRAPDGEWKKEVIFTDRDKGHWLCAAEVDGRNGTDELLTCGYSGRIVLLSRPPGFGKKGLVGAGR